MNNRKQLTILFVLMVVIGSFIFSTIELANIRIIGILLLIVFGALLGGFVSILAKTSK